AAVVLGAADDDERNLARLLFAGHTKMVELVVEDFTRTLPPVCQDAHASFEFEINRVSDPAVGAGAGDAEKVAGSFRLLERRGQTERDVADFAACDLVGSSRYFPGKFQFFRKHVGGSRGKQRHGYAMAVLCSGKAVDDFVDCAVAPTCDDELAAVSASA